MKENVQTLAECVARIVSFLVVLPPYPMGRMKTLKTPTSGKNLVDKSVRLVYHI